MRIMKNMRGVTLMELMIVVVIIGILTAVAYPSYTQFVVRAKRTEAKALLLQIAIDQERFYLQNSIFGDMADLQFDEPQITDSEAYSVTITANDASNFSATATYLLGGEEVGKCLTFTIDGRGTKTSAPDGNCWTRRQ
jgi:type IV pilus assembly protein PilE